MKILLTGAAGFLGRAVVARLQERGDHTRGFDSSFGDDVTDSVSFDSALATFRPDAVVHLAALLTPECAADPVRGALVNCVGTAIALNRSLCAGVRSIVFASSVAAIEPGSVYGATKAFGEHVAVALRSEHPDARVIALRLGWVYGQGRTRGWVDLQALIEGFALEQSEVRYPDYREPLDWTRHTPFLETTYFVRFALSGKLGFLDEEMAVFRYHSEGIYGKATNAQNIQAAINAHLLVGRHFDLEARESYQLGLARMQQDLSRELLAMP